MSTAEATGVILEVRRSGNPVVADRWASRGAFVDHLSDVQENARQRCPKGVLCCLNVGLQQFNETSTGMGDAAVVEVSCADGESCASPELVGEVAMNHVLGEGDMATQEPVLGGTF